MLREVEAGFAATGKVVPMFDWQPDWLRDFELTWRTGLWGFLIALAALALSSSVVIFVLLRLPATYFLHSSPPSLRADHRFALRWAICIGKNVLGVVLALLGVLLSLPGIPGPGFLLILIGMTLLNFPGKRRLARKLAERSSVLRAINLLREHFGKSPLVLDGKPGEPDQQAPADPGKNILVEHSADDAHDAGKIFGEKRRRHARWNGTGFQGANERFAGAR